VPSADDAEALPRITAKSPIPVIADIHFQPRYVFAAIDAGCAAVRVNPGNIKKFDDKVAEIARAARDAGVSIRIGVNAGSLDARLLAKYGKATPEALVESALWECSLFAEHGFEDLKLSVKHHDPVVMIAAYRQLAERCEYPLHLGVTEAGPRFQGTIKSAVAFGVLLADGIGDTIRVSLSAPPVEEVKVGAAILESLGLRPRRLEIVSCPSCGRAQVDVYKLAEQVTAAFDGFEVPLRIAVMGCVVNGPGEAREADLGVSSGNGKGQIFVRGKVIRTVPESQISRGTGPTQPNRELNEYLCQRPVMGRRRRARRGAVRVSGAPLRGDRRHGGEQRRGRERLHPGGRSAGGARGLRPDLPVRRGGGGRGRRVRGGGQPGGGRVGGRVAAGAGTDGHRAAGSGVRADRDVGRVAAHACRHAWNQLEEMRRVVATSATTDEWSTDRKIEASNHLWQVYQERQDRLNTASSGGISSVVWFAMLAGAIMAIALPVLFGGPRPATHILIVSILTATMTLLLYATSELQNPYSGGAQVDPTAFQSALDRLG
jgi:(E)-4-hydroxy-3-methylbut-2-enyl-diphosphate synthase